MDIQEVLNDCVIEGNNVKLPNIQLDRADYMKVKKSLEGIGGKWKGGKVAAFQFPSDPTTLMGRVKQGEKVNLKKEYQFFETPIDLADRVIELADISNDHSVLEPSAGQGALVAALERTGSPVFVDVYELMDRNADILSGHNVAILGKDFLESRHTEEYDRIIANPPFTKNQDIDHIVHMTKALKKGGRLVSVASTHWQHSTNKKEAQFRWWLNNIGAQIIDVEQGAFKSSGTNIATTIIVINK